MFAPAFDAEFAREVREGLTRPGQKTLPCRYLYDAVGSALFEAIALVPEYGLTRADARVIETHAAELVALLPPKLVVAELGSGSGSKTRPILEQVARRRPTTYYPIDVSATALERCEHELGGMAKVAPVVAGYLEGLRQVLEERPARTPLLLLFLGSTIGNFEPQAAVDFLIAIRKCLSAGDALLLGTDLVKPVDRLIDAYDDAAGVTAAFNLNLLARINRELGADFDVRQFEHMVRYVSEFQRIEMHLVSRIAQAARIAAAGVTVEFAAGETVFTESCHKFRREQVCTMAARSGFRVEAQWTDEEWPFAESLLVAA
jgi:L-histidine Nalpha-methyltransferase